MAMFIIDTEKRTCTPYMKDTSSELSRSEQMIRTLISNRGTAEYNGIVATIQKWYYGSLVKASWCATCISYLLNQAGISSHKQENVYRLMLSLQSDHYNGTFYDKKNLPSMIKRGDILFWLWSGDTMTATSSKHVGMAEYDSNKDTVFCIGGNQKDKICTLEYERKYLYAVYRLAR